MSEHYEKRPRKNKTYHTFKFHHQNIGVFLFTNIKKSRAFRYIIKNINLCQTSVLQIANSIRQAINSCYIKKALKRNR